ncbi:hypothetical protein XENTR_v10018624 [Xenopus tropicalis]|nr:hypothetical protein XENTR_v10018624 [Xenopus tropicalis]
MLSETIYPSHALGPIPLCRVSLYWRLKRFGMSPCMIPCMEKVERIIKDSSHPSHRLFKLLLSGRRYSSRLSNSFFHQAIRLLNTDH